MLKVLQVGYGYWGTNVANKLVQSKEFELSYLAETDRIRKTEAAKKLPKSVKIINDYTEQICNDNIDAVVICTQTEYSYEIAMNAMENGKHIFIEKPLAKDVERAKNLTKKANEKNLILHCDHLMIYHPVIRYIKNMIDKNEIGDIMYIDISRINLGPVRKDINTMLDLAVHDIAVIDYLLGGLIPNLINAYGTKFFGNQETITYLTIKQGNILININSSWVSPVKVRRMTVAGTKKMLIFDDVKTDKLRIYDSGIDMVQGNEYGEYEFKTRAGDIFIPHIEHEDALLNSLEHFAACIRNNTRSLSGSEQSMRVMNVMDRAQKLLS